MFSDAKIVQANELRMAVYEAGSGPAVIFVHGFPELAYSWRHQLPALADAGFRAIAPDMRGYGKTEAPEGVEHYRMSALVNDLLGLLDSLDLESATFVGHDWGALVVWNLAMVAPHRVDKVIALNIPHLPRPPVDPIELFRQRLGEDFYIVNFQDSDEADRVFAADPGRVFDAMMRKNQISRKQFASRPKAMQVLSLLRVVQQTEVSGDPVLTDAEREVYVNAFSRTGFTNPINWYRNMSANWAAMGGVEQRINIPTLFIAAADDVVIAPEQIAAMKPLVSDLTIETLEPCGHWTQQERPEDVNRLVIDWLSDRS